MDENGTNVLLMSITGTNESNGRNGPFWSLLAITIESVDACRRCKVPSTSRVAFWKAGEFRCIGDFLFMYPYGTTLWGFLLFEVLEM